MAVVASFASIYLLLSGHPGGKNPAQVARSVSTGSLGWVRLSGDVRFSGVYPVDANVMTRDVILLAEPLCDIPAALNNVPAQTGGNLLVSCLSREALAVVAATSMGSSERLVLNIPLDLNHASAADLEKIPGIGPVMAERIIRFRQKNGEFKRLEELEMVQGIGSGKLAKLSKYLQVAGTAIQY